MHSKGCGPKGREGTTVDTVALDALPPPAWLCAPFCFFFFLPALCFLPEAAFLKAATPPPVPLLALPPPGPPAPPAEVDPLAPRLMAGPGATGATSPPSSSELSEPVE